MQNGDSLWASLSRTREDLQLLQSRLSCILEIMDLYLLHLQLRPVGSYQVHQILLNRDQLDPRPLEVVVHEPELHRVDAPGVDPDHQLLTGILLLHVLHQ